MRFNKIYIERKFPSYTFLRKRRRKRYQNHSPVDVFFFGYFHYKINFCLFVHTVDGKIHNHTRFAYIYLFAIANHSIDIYQTTFRYHLKPNVNNRTTNAHRKRWISISCCGAELWFWETKKKRLAFIHRSDSVCGNPKDTN